MEEERRVSRTRKGTPTKQKRVRKRRKKRIGRRFKNLRDGFLEFLSGIRELDILENLWDGVIRFLYSPASVVLLFILVAALGLGGLLLYRNLHVYHEYDVRESVDREENTGAIYRKVGRNLVHYSPDGITSENLDTDVHWNISYDLENPIADVSGNCIGIADLKGASVYLFDENGLIGSFNAASSISKIRVSESGIAAVVQNDNNINWIDLYTTTGTVLVRIKCTLEETGYPIDLDLSPDGSQMVVSYLRIEKGQMKTDLVFYNFGDYGQMKENNIVKKETFRGTVIPDVEYLKNSQTLVLRENGYSVYEGERKINETVHVEFGEDADIQSVAYTNNTILLITNEKETLSEKNDSGEINSYDVYTNWMNFYRITSGSLVKRRKTNAAYSNITMEDDKVMMYSDDSLQIFDTSGKQIFEGEVKLGISSIMNLNKKRDYMIVNDRSIVTIRIR